MSELSIGKLVKPGQLFERDADGTYRFFFDSSMIRTFRECPQMFKYKYVDNIHTRGRHFKTAVGSWWSSTMELYYKAFREHDLTCSSAIEFAIHEWREHDMDSFKNDAPASLEEFGGAIGAATMVREYFDWSYPIDQRTWTVVSVEEGSGRNREIFIGRLEHGDAKVEVYYIIKPDLYVVENGLLFPVDHKTKDTIRQGMQHSFKPHFQTMGYIIAAQEFAKQLEKETGLSRPLPDRTIINVAARNTPGPKAKNQERFRRFPISYSVDQLDEWRRKVLHTALELRLCFERTEWPWSENACHNYSGCAYRPLDSVPMGAREIMIKSVYTIGKPWVPYKTEEEEEE